MADPQVLEPLYNHTIDAVAERMAELSNDTLAFEEGPEDAPKVETLAEQAKAAEQPEAEEDQPEQDAKAEDAEDAAEEDADESAEEDADEDSGEDEAQESADAEVLEITLESGETAKVPTDDLAKLYADSEKVKAEHAEIADRWREFETLKSKETERLSEQAQEIESRLEYLRQINVVGEAPNPAMLDASSPQYDPDNYHLQRAQWEQRKEIDERIKSDLGAAQKFRTEEQDRAYQALISAEAQKTAQEWPEIVAHGEVGDKARGELVSAANRYYSITKDE